eukprot:scaffold907_cov398-Prasinococcus_capsulatus_cf.AAC.15
MLTLVEFADDVREIAADMAPTTPARRARLCCLSEADASVFRGARGGLRNRRILVPMENGESTYPTHPRTCT